MIGGARAKNLLNDTHRPFLLPTGCCSCYQEKNEALPQH